MEGTKQQWLWPGWIPDDSLSLITGPPGSELTRLAVWLASSMLLGGQCPDGALPLIDPDRPVVWLDTEGNYERLVERLVAIDSPKDRWFWPVDPEEPDRDPRIDLADERWLEIVAQHAAFRRPAWVIVDRLGTRHREIVRETYRALDAMAEIARDVGAAITFLYPQDVARPIVQRRSAQWARLTGKMATVMTLKPWAPRTKDMLFKVTNTVFGEHPDALRLRFDTDMPAVVPRPAAPSGLPVERAVAILKAELARGQRGAIEVTDRMRWQIQVSPRTLQRAKRQAGVVSYKSGGRWWWVLASSASIAGSRTSREWRRRQAS